jgi:hypothetical protein
LVELKKFDAEKEEYDSTGEIEKAKARFATFMEKSDEARPRPHPTPSGTPDPHPMT